MVRMLHDANHFENPWKFRGWGAVQQCGQHWLKTCPGASAQHQAMRPKARCNSVTATAATFKQGAFLQQHGCPAGHFRPELSTARMIDYAEKLAKAKGVVGISNSRNFDHRRRPRLLRTAMAITFFCPTSTTSRLPRVMPV